MTAAKSILLKSPARRRAVSLMGRLGYGARGAIYALVGVSAARATLDPAQRFGGLGGSLKLLQHDWLGAGILILLASGLACLAIWLTLAALYRRDHPGRTHWILVAGMLGDAAVYVAFMGGVLGMVFGMSTGGERELQAWIGWLIAGTAGRILAGVAGGIVAGCGVGLIAWGALGNLDGPLELKLAEKRLLKPIGRYGTAGRGAAIALVGCYLLVAAVHGNAREAHELGGVLNEMRELPYGAAVTGAFALAFIGAGLADFASAAFRRFDPSDPSALLRRGRRTTATRRSSARAR